MSVKTVAAVAVGLGIIAASAGGFLIWKHQQDKWKEGACAGIVMLKDKAVAWRSADDYKQFRKELRGYDGPQKEGLAASWITSGRAVLLPRQEARLICLDEPLALIRLNDGESWITIISQIEGDDAESDSNIIEDRIVQMIEGK